MSIGDPAAKRQLPFGSAMPVAFFGGKRCKGLFSFLSTLEKCDILNNLNCTCIYIFSSKFNFIALESMIVCHIYFLSSFQGIIVPLKPDLNLDTPVVKGKSNDPV